MARIAYCSFVINILVESSQCNLTAWQGWGVVTSRLWRLPTVASFHPLAGLIISVLVLSEMHKILRMTALCAPLLANETN